MVKGELPAEACLSPGAKLKGVGLGEKRVGLFMFGDWRWCC